MDQQIGLMASYYSRKFKDPILPLTSNLFSGKVPQPGRNHLHKITLETAPTPSVLTDYGFHEAVRQNPGYKVSMNTENVHFCFSLSCPQRHLSELLADAQ